MKSLDTKLPAPVLAVAIAGGMWLHGHDAQAADFAPVLRSGLAALIAQLSAVLAVAAFLAFRKAGTTIDPMHPERAATLVTHGIYRYSRNPMYLSLLLLLVAYAVAQGALLALAGPALFLAYVTRFQIVPEERALAAKFGAQFDAYRARVRRWL